MAYPTDTYTGADLDVFRPEIWGEKINDYFRASLIFSSFFVDRSDELVEGGDTLHTGNLQAFTANTKSAATAVTLNSPTDTKIDLVVDTWKEVSFAIEDREAAQVKRSYSLQNRYALNAGYEAGKARETAIGALFAGFTNSVGSGTATITDAVIVEAIATLEGNNVPGMWSGEVAFILHPNTFWRQVQSINKFSLAVNAPVQDPVSKKPQHNLYGIPVLVSSLVPVIGGSTGRVNLLASRDAIHTATLALGVMSEGGMVGAGGVRVQANYIPEQLSTLVTADIVYGEIENRDTDGAVKILTHETIGA